MTKAEVKSVLSNLAGDKWIIACLLYGAGLRLMEALRLRVQDLDFNLHQITVRDGKGNKDRVTMFPASVKKSLGELASAFAADPRLRWVYETKNKYFR